MALGEDKAIHHVPVRGRGIGICAGAYLGGKPAIVMMNAGFIVREHTGRSVFIRAYRMRC
jgi:sulfopyruvate decarboxylase TPP-binding subunit